VVEEEAIWVKKIFAWYVDRVPMMEIRRRLIEADAPQKGSSTPRRIRWARSTIQAILKAAKEYAFGIKIQRREGEAFEIAVPAIIDPAIYQKFLEVRNANNTYRARRVRHKYLLGGLLYCVCGRKWQTRTASFTRKKSNGEKSRERLFMAHITVPRIIKNSFILIAPGPSGRPRLMLLYGRKSAK
jgi:hypothetical protein